MSDPGAVLKTKLAERRALLVPGAANALTARIIADLGFEAAYVTGAGLTNMYLGFRIADLLVLRKLHSRPLRFVMW